MTIIYSASISSGNKETATFNTITNATPDTVNTDITKLSIDNYPSGQTPSRDQNGYLLPNAINQAIFKNQPLSWWITSLNNSSIQYRPISNTINWAFVNSDSKDIYILFDITKIIIPNKTKSVDINKDTHIATTTYVDNNCIIMTSTNNSPFPLLKL